MGEYIQLATGEVVKIGTCENCYYTTWEQLRAAVTGAQQVPGNLPPAEYLNPAHGWRYRFPFPDEAAALGHYVDYDRGVTVTVPAELLPAEHDAVTLRIPTMGARPDAWDPYALSVRVGCPLGPDPAQRPPTRQTVQPVAQVVQQKRVEGALWVVLRCPYCGVKWRVAPAEGAALVAHLRRVYADDGLRLALADRIAAGYEAMEG